MSKADESYPLKHVLTHSDSSDLLNLLLGFLNIPGQILLIRGAPGTGKTTLSLELLRRTRDSSKIYVSSRVSPVKLRHHFPWIDEVIDALSGKTARANPVEFLYDLHIIEKDHLLNRILKLKNSKERSVLVIDSWEGALKNVDKQERRELESIILSGLDESMLSLLLVTEDEHGEDGLGYMADGVVRLQAEELEGRKLRIMVVDKLRGARVQAHRGLFSLEEGRFGIKTWQSSNGTPPSPKTFEVVPHGEASWSTGCLDLDALVGGGLRKGSFLLMEIDEKVPPEHVRGLLNIIRLNFLNQEGCCFIVPNPSFNSESTAEELRPYLRGNGLEERVRIVEYNPNLPPAPYRVPLTGRVLEDISTFIDMWNSLGSISQSRVLTADFDAMQTIYGEDLTLSRLSQIGGSMRNEKALIVGLASRRTKLNEDFRRDADYQLRLQMVEGCLSLYGIKPLTPLCTIESSMKESYPRINLVEVV